MNAAEKYLKEVQDEWTGRRHKDGTICRAKSEKTCPETRESVKEDESDAKVASGSRKETLENEKSKEDGNGEDRVHQRISAEALRGVHEGTGLLEGASVAARRGEEACSRAKGGILTLQEKIDAQERAVKELAEERGVWKDGVDLEFDKKYGEYVAGSESIVYFDEENGKVHKVISDSMYAGPRQNLNRVRLHNKYFPETALSIKGFGTIGSEWIGSKFAFVAEQPLIHIARGADKDEVRELMEGLGFSSRFSIKNGDEWTNEDGVTVSDLHDENVVIDDAGKVVVIDCFIVGPEE